MDNKDKVKFAEQMAGLAEMYEINLSDVVMEMWFKALEGYDIKEISAAIYDYICNPDNGRFKPKPADIIKMLDGSTTDQAYIAWTKVDKAVRTVGDYQSVVFDDPLIHKVITDMGGWVGFGDNPEKEWVFTGKEFMERYRGYSARKKLPEYPSKLIGLHEDNNFKHGFEVDGPVLIGDEKKAQIVLGGTGTMITQEYKGD